MGVPDVPVQAAGVRHGRLRRRARRRAVRRSPGLRQPAIFLLLLSILFVAAVVVGGQGNRWGVMIGAAIVALPAGEVPRLRASGGVLLFGAALIVLAIYRPQGILPPRRTVPGATPDGTRRSRKLERGPAMPEDGEERPAAPSRACSMVNNITHDVRWRHRAGRRQLRHPARARSSASSGPTAPARPRCFNVVTGVYKPTAGDVSFRGTAARRTEAAPDHPPWHRADLPEHPAVQVHDGAGERHGRRRRPPPTGVLSTRSSGLPRHRREEREGEERAHGAAAVRGPADQARRARRATCPTATSAAWRSPGRWPPSRRCSASTSPRPASTRPRSAR